MQNIRVDNPRLRAKVGLLSRRIGFTLIRIGRIQTSQLGIIRAFEATVGRDEHRTLGERA